MLLNSNLSTAATTLTKWLVSIPSVSQTKGNSFITQSIYEGLSEFPYYKQHPQHLIKVPHADGAKSSIVALVKAIDEIEDTLVLLCNVDTNSPAHYGILKNISTQSDELERQLAKLAGDNQELKQKLEQHDAIFGLGVLESKCAAGCMLAAIKELSDNHVRANLNVVLICTCDNAHNYQGLKHCIDAVHTLCEQEHLTLRLTLNAQPQLNNPTFANSSALFNVAANTVSPHQDSEPLESKNQDLTADQSALEQSNASNALASLGANAHDNDGQAQDKGTTQQQANQRMAAAALSKVATPELCLYTGNYGKIEPSFYILGQSTAVSQPFNGFSASLIAAELIHEFELNPKILQKLHQKPLIPTFDSLKVKDFGKEFSPDGVQLSFNLPILPAVDLSDVLELMKEIAANAIESAAEVVDEREAILAKLNNLPFVPQTQDAEVISFSDLLERACSNYTGDMRQAVNSLIKKCKKEGFNSHQSAITIIERLNDFAQLPRPSIVVYFTDNLIPAQSLNANNYHDRELFMLLDNLMRDFAKETELQAHMATHYAPTEVGFLRPEGIDEAAPLLEQESPVGFSPLPSLNVPTVTLGVLGGNLSQVSEYVEANMCQYLPHFVLQLVDTLATNPLSQSKAMQPHDDLQRHLEELGQKAEEIAAAALNEIRAVEQQSKEGSGFYTQVSQGTLSPSQLNYKDFRKNQLHSAKSKAASQVPATAPTTPATTPATLATTLASDSAQPLASQDSTQTSTVSSQQVAPDSASASATPVKSTDTTNIQSTVPEVSEDTEPRSFAAATTVVESHERPAESTAQVTENSETHKSAVASEATKLTAPSAANETSATSTTYAATPAPTQAAPEVSNPTLNPEDMPVEAIPEVTKVVAVAPNQEAQLLDQAQQKLKSAFGSFKKFIHTGKEQLSKVKVPNILPKQAQTKSNAKDNIEPQLQLPQSQLTSSTEPEIDQAVAAASAIAIAVNGNKTTELVTGFSATDGDDINLRNGATERLVADADIFEQVQEQEQAQSAAPVVSAPSAKQEPAVTIQEDSVAPETTSQVEPAEMVTPVSEPVATPAMVEETVRAEDTEATEGTDTIASTDPATSTVSSEVTTDTETTHNEQTTTATKDATLQDTASEQATEAQPDDSATKTKDTVAKTADQTEDKASSEHLATKTAHTANTTIVFTNSESRFNAVEPQKVTRTMSIPEYEEEKTLSSNTRIVHSTDTHVETVHESLPTQDTIITGHEQPHEVVALGKSTTIITNNQPAFVSTREELPPLHAEVKETPLSTILSPRVEQTAIKYESQPKAKAPSEQVSQESPAEDKTQETPVTVATPEQVAPDAHAEKAEDKAEEVATKESKDTPAHVEPNEQAQASDAPQTTETKEIEEDKASANAKNTLEPTDSKQDEDSEASEESKADVETQEATEPQTSAVSTTPVAQAQVKPSPDMAQEIEPAQDKPQEFKTAPQEHQDKPKTEQRTEQSADDKAVKTSSTSAEPSNLKPMRNAEDALMYMMGEIDADFKVDSANDGQKLAKQAPKVTQEAEPQASDNKSDASSQASTETPSSSSENSAAIMQSLTNIAMQYPEYHNAQEVMLQKESILKIEAKDTDDNSSLATSLDQGLGSTYAHTTLEGLALEKLDPAQAFAQLLGEIEKDDSAKNNFREDKQDVKGDKAKRKAKTQESTTQTAPSAQAAPTVQVASVQPESAPAQAQENVVVAQVASAASTTVQNNGNFVPPKESNFYGDLLPTEHPVRTRSLAPSVMGGSATLRTMKSMQSAPVKPSAGKIRSSQLAAKRGGVAGVPGLAGAAGVLGTGDGRTTIPDLNQPRTQNVRRGSQAIGGLNQKGLSTQQQHSVASNITSTLIDSRPTGASTAFNGMESAISSSIRSSGVQGKASPTPVNPQNKGNKGGLGPGVIQRRQNLKPDAGGNTKDYASLTTAMSAARLRNTKIRTPLKLNESGQAMVSSKSRDERRAALHKAMYGGLDEEVAVVNPVLGLGNKSTSNKTELGSKVTRIEGAVESAKSEAPSKAKPQVAEDADSKQKGSFIAFDKGDFLNYDPSALRASFKKEQAHKSAQEQDSVASPSSGSAS